MQRTKWAVWMLGVVLMGATGCQSQDKTDDKGNGNNNGGTCKQEQIAQTNWDMLKYYLAGEAGLSTFFMEKKENIPCGATVVFNGTQYDGTVSTVYDSQGRLTEATIIEKSSGDRFYYLALLYDDHGKVKEANYGIGFFGGHIQFNYDQSGRLQKLVEDDGSGNFMKQNEIEYDSGGFVIALRQEVASADTTKVTFDVTSCQLTGGKKSTLDEATQAFSQTGTVTTKLDSGRLTNLDVTPIDTTTQNTKVYSFTHDSAGRLSSFASVETQPDASVAESLSLSLSYSCT